MKSVLAQVNEVIETLEDKGFMSQASKLDKIFVKLAQKMPEKHFVSEGETLTSIAERYNLSLGQIYQRNPGINAEIHAGQPINLKPIPVQPSFLDKTVQNVVKNVKDFFNPNPQPIAVGQPFIYKIQQGDTFDGVVNDLRNKLAARGQYVGMKQSFQDLVLSLNPGLDKGKIKPNQILRLPRETSRPK